MKAVVIHHTLNTVGGETAVAIETIEALYNLGYDVELFSVQKPCLENIAKAYGRKKIPIKSIKCFFPFKMNYFGTYQRLLNIIPRLGLKDSDIVINTNGNVLPYKIPSYIPCISYFHFPTWLPDYLSYNNNKYRRSLLWYAYYKPYQVMLNIFMKKTLLRSDIILASSQYASNILRKAYPKLHTYVLYPSIDVERFSLAYRSISRGRQVLVISRFSPEKQIEKVIEISQLLGDNVMFKVIGSLIPSNQPYFNSLQKKIRNSGLENKISLTANVTNKELLDAMSESRVYLHTMEGEHFGMSIVEAMAAGLVPVVPSSGGCSEIVPIEYHYNTLKEAADCISKNIDEYDNKKRDLMYEFAKRFSTSQFRNGMQRYIEQACNSISGNFNRGKHRGRGFH